MTSPSFLGGSTKKISPLKQNMVTSGNTSSVLEQYNYLTEQRVESDHYEALKEEARRDRALVESLQRDNEILRDRCSRLDHVEKVCQQLLEDKA